MREILLNEVSPREIERVLPLVAGLLNSGGGVIRFGGVQKNAEAQELQRAISEGICPRAPVFVRQTSGDASELTVEVPAGSEPPYAYRDTAFVIDGDECHEATVEQIREWVLGSEHGQSRWENRFCLCEDAESVVDRVSMNAAVEKINQVGRMKIDVSGETALILNELALSRYGRLLNAGLVLLGRTPGRYAPQTIVRLTHFAGNKTSSRIIASKTFDGPLCDVIDAAKNYVNENAPRLTRFDAATGNRVEETVYPVFAVREAIVNACAHREYESAFGGVSILLFSDRLEVWNSGRLPEGVSVERLNKGQGAPSVLVNPTIVGHLYARDYMEKAGRGSSVIPFAAKAVGTKVRWKQIDGRGVCITFTHSVKGLRENSSLEGDYDVERKRVLDTIVENPGLRKPLLMSLTGCSTGVLQRVLDALREAGRIEYRGSKRTGGYFARGRD